MKTRPASTPDRRKRRRYVLGVMVLLTVVACVVGWVAWNSGTDVPNPNLTGSGVGVKQAIAAARNKVLENPRDASAWGRYGMVLMVHQAGSEAIACFERAEKLDATEAKWPYLQALTLLTVDQPKPAKATACLKRSARLCGNIPDAPRLALAQSYLANGNTASAKTEFQRLLDSNPKHSPAMLGMARVLICSGKWNDAVPWLKKCMRSPFTGKAAHALLAEIRLRTGKNSEAIEIQQKTLKLPDDKLWPDPYSDETLDLKSARHSYVARYRALLSGGRRITAADTLRQAEMTYRDLYWQIEGRQRLEQGDGAAAESAFQKAIEHDPSNVEIHYDLGLALFAQKKYGPALKSFDRSLELEISYVPAYLAKGKCLLKIADESGAKRAFELATRYSPLNPDAHCRLGKLLAKQGHVKQARSHLETAIQFDPAHDEAKTALEKLRRKK